MYVCNVGLCLIDQILFVSSIMFDYRTQSNDWVRLPNVRLDTPGDLSPGKNSNDGMSANPNIYSYPADNSKRND